MIIYPQKIKLEYSRNVYYPYNKKLDAEFNRK